MNLFAYAIVAVREHCLFFNIYDKNQLHIIIVTTSIYTRLKTRSTVKFCMALYNGNRVDPFPERKIVINFAIILKSISKVLLNFKEKL